MDHDVATTQHGSWRPRVVRADLVVVNHRTGGLVHDLQAELVDATTPAHRAVHGGKDEAVVSSPVDRSRALVLRLRARDHEPVVTGAVETEARRLEPEFRVPARDGGALLVFRFEAEGRLASER